MTTPSPSSAMPANRTQISFCGYVVLFAVFAAISFSFGYQTLNRYDPRPASWDAEAYYNMVRSDYAHALPPFRFRVLTPALAGLLYRALPAGVGGSWDPVFLALLIVNSAMMALACLVLLRLGELLTGSPTVGLTAAFLYITGWNVVNATLGGALVDAAEILILLSLTVSVLQSRWWCVPLLMAVGPFAKETILLFGFAFCCVMLLARASAKAKRRVGDSRGPCWGWSWERCRFTPCEGSSAAHLTRNMLSPGIACWPRCRRCDSSFITSWRSRWGRSLCWGPFASIVCRAPCWRLPCRWPCWSSALPLMPALPLPPTDTCATRSAPF